MDDSVEEKRFQRPTFMLVALLSCVVLGCIGIPLLQSLYGGIDFRADPIGNKMRELAQAKARWSAHHPSNYRLVVASGDCLQDIEIHGGRLAQTFKNTCRSPGLTVTDLFLQLEQDIPNFRWVNGPGCDILAVHATYDVMLGYPLTIEYRQEWATPLNIGGLTYIRYRPLGKWDKRPCTAMGMKQEGYVVKSLTPLP